MNTVARILSIPVVLLGTVAAAGAQNAGSNPLETMRMVVEARNAAQACGFASSDEIDELKHYAALSEIAAAKSTAMELVQSTRAAAESRQPSCNSRDQQQVQFVLDASRFAVSGGKGKSPTPPVTASVEQQQLEPVMRRGFATGTGSPMPQVQPDVAPQPVFDARDPFVRYSMQVRGYFLERKCNFLDYNTELDYWKRLTARYKVMVGEYGRKRVNAAQIEGENSAASIACNRPTRQFINDAYRDLSSVSRL